MTPNIESSKPLTHTIAKWYGYILSAMFLLFGGVRIILGFMDNKHEGVLTSLFFLGLGIIVVTAAIGFRDGRMWGWYAMVAVCSLSLIGLFVSTTDASGIVMMIVSAGMLALLFAPATRAHFRQP